MSKAGFSKKPRAYIPKCRKDDNPPPTFSIRRLDPLEIFDVMEKHSLNEDIFDGKGELKANTLSVSRSLRVGYDYLRLGVVGWENVTDENNEVIPFSEENIKCLDMDIVMELGAAVQGVIPEAEAKNSETPSLPSNG